MVTMMASTDDGHHLSSSEEIMAKARWSTWKKVANIVPTYSTTGADERCTNDSSIWDNVSVIISLFFLLRQVCSSCFFFPLFLFLTE